MSLFVAAAIAAAVAALVTSLLVPVVERLALAAKAVDHPGARKQHARPVPRLGGLAIVIGLVFGAGAMLVPLWNVWLPAIPTATLAALLLGTGLVFLTGLIDDFAGMSALRKLLLECVAAVMVVMSGWSFEVLAVPGGVFQLGVLGSVLGVVWIVGVTNAINLIDGLDGLATGVVAIIAASFLAYALAYANPFAVVVTAAMVGSCLGFLPHNWKPARIFMGDAGSLTLGFLLASLSVYGTLKAPVAVAVLVPILALGVPVFDTLLVMLVRFLERPKGPFFDRFLRVLHADRNHLHHLLEELVTEHRSVVRWIYGMVVLSCAMAFVVALTKRSGLGFILLAVEIVAIVVIRQLGLARQARMLSRRQREELDQGPRAFPED